MRFLICTLFIFVCVTAYAQLTPYEINGKNYTATYQECITYYKNLAKQYQGISIEERGLTDVGIPLHIIKINAANEFDSKIWHQQDKCILLINNGIHPGEPDGIDASMLLARDLLQQIKRNQLSKDICIAIIPIYNIGGALNRSPYYRVDQNGPAEFGSRGNGQNLDLNRDFIKCDSKNAMAFSKIFQDLQPHIFVDNHVSDGADYPYVMTLLSTQKDKLGGVLGQYLEQKLEPYIYKEMRSRGTPIIPYVNVWGKDARTGWTQFFDSPRYSSGYAALFNTLSFVPETHMLKPYKQRVEVTLGLMQAFVKFCNSNAQDLVRVKKLAQKNMLQQQVFPLSWSLDKTQFNELEYSGYAYKTKLSKVSNLPISFYDTATRYTENIPYYNHYQASVTTTAPRAYIIPQAWSKVIERLQVNNVEITTLAKDTEMLVQYYRIDSFESTKIPFEGHHANSKVQVSLLENTITFRKGDIMIPTAQNAKRFLIETLEPHAMDSYFSWNFFDAILMQKEGFTDYAFEANAAQYLAQHPALRDSLTRKQLSDTSFAKDAQAQLEFVYKHSLYYEPNHNVYPVYKTVTAPREIKALTGDIILNKKDE